MSLPLVSIYRSNTCDNESRSCIYFIINVRYLLSVSRCLGVTRRYPQRVTPSPTVNIDVKSAGYYGNALFSSPFAEIGPP